MEESTLYDKLRAWAKVVLYSMSATAFIMLLLLIAAVVG